MLCLIRELSPHAANLREKLSLQITPPLSFSTSSFYIVFCAEIFHPRESFSLHVLIEINRTRIYIKL